MGANKIDVPWESRRNEGPISAKKKQKPNCMEPLKKSILATKKCNKSPTEAKKNTHSYTYMKATVTVVL